LTFYNPSHDVELAFRESIFTVVSMQTTTGLASCDYTLWPVQLMPIILFVMFAGACSGSTSGGFKCIRLSIIYRILKNEFTHILHPRAIMPVRINGAVMSPSITQTLIGFITLFVGSLFVGAFILALFGVTPNDVHPEFDYYEAFGLAMSSISNVGPGMGYYGPVHSWAILTPFAKMMCSFLMLIGRLEIFPIMILFTRTFWRK
jgi:trk system potassium uptake protein TrkH